MKENLSKLLICFLVFSFFSCGNNKQNKKDCIVYEGTILSGLYHFELVDGVDDLNDTYIYVFEGNMQYKFYPNSENSINYETPTHYYIEEDKFYSCGISLDANDGIVPLDKCKKGDYKYTILSMENTVDKFDSKIHLIKMKSKYGNRMVILRKFI